MRKTKTKKQLEIELKDFKETYDISMKEIARLSKELKNLQDEIERIISEAGRSSHVTLSVNKLQGWVDG